MDIKSSIRIVLVGTTHPGNIGAAARAMKTMGLHHLYIVEPRCFPDSAATVRAAGAEDLLENAVVTTQLSEALIGCHRVYGTSARIRSLQWPAVNPREAAQQIMSVVPQQQVAIVFGREHAGLTNEELDQCHAQIVIPSNPEFSSLNLAASVQVVSYELQMASNISMLQNQASDEYATQEQINGLFDHWEQVLIDVGFLDPQFPGQVMRRLKRIFARTKLELTEINVLRGILAETQRAVSNKGEKNA